MPAADNGLMRMAKVLIHNEKTGGLDGLAETLRELQVRFWIDSGVLLGLVRDGRLMEWEKDIDLAILDSEIDKVLQARSLFAAMGYTMVVNSYQRTIYSIGLRPNTADDILLAAIHVYYPAGEYLWSPQTQLYVPPPAPDVRLTRRTWLGQFLRWIIEKAYYTKAQTRQKTGLQILQQRKEGVISKVSRTLYNGIDRGFLAETWPFREIYVPLTWVIPQKMVLPLRSIEHNGKKLPVPGNVEEYLSYRYGNWRFPVTDWFYWRDDGAVVRQRPHAVRQSLESTTTTD